MTTTLATSGTTIQLDDPINPAAEAWKIFQENTAKHELTVLHEQGLYRHLRMARPGTRMGSWDIVTWPGHLATSGDIADGLTFARVEDMIGFFNLADGKDAYYSDGAPSIDFRYWAQKLQGNQRETVKEYKHADFIEYVKDTLADRLENRYEPAMTQESVDRLIAEATALDEHEVAAREWLSEYEEHFPDSWQDSFQDYTFHFQYACYAINAAVQAYLEANPIHRKG